jgi:hypothetical protein
MPTKKGACGPRLDLYSVFSVNSVSSVPLWSSSNGKGQK